MGRQQVGGWVGERVNMTCGTNDKLSLLHHCKATHAASNAAGVVMQPITCATHLIRIHVGVRSGSGLPDTNREVAVQLPFNHLVARGLCVSEAWGSWVCQ